ncbi:GntR family transcriptional regulator [Dactylosporangium sp. NPDC000555]|uniref:GntR family transcriptional regulator n=1 Tax=Dactylosporangium sp. NPDC000555 TaxID=3154260 RepID=UPI003326D2ED
MKALDSADFLPGSTLPGERALAAQLGGSRAPLRLVLKAPAETGRGWRGLGIRGPEPGAYRSARTSTATFPRDGQDERLRRRRPARPRLHRQRPARRLRRPRRRLRPL